MLCSAVQWSWQGQRACKGVCARPLQVMPRQCKRCGGYTADVSAGEDWLVTSLGMRLQRAGCCPVWFCSSTRLSNRSQGIVSALPGASQKSRVNLCAEPTWMETCRDELQFVGGQPGCCQPSLHPLAASKAQGAVVILLGYLRPQPAPGLSCAGKTNRVVNSSRGGSPLPRLCCQRSHDVGLWQGAAGQ